MPDVGEIIARLKASAASGGARGRGRRSALYVWFRANHDRLSAEFERTPPAWGRLASLLGETGLTNGRNGTLTGNGARLVWYRVRREVAATRARRSNPSQGGAAEPWTVSPALPMPSAPSPVPDARPPLPDVPRAVLTASAPVPAPVREAPHTEVRAAVPPDAPLPAPEPVVPRFRPAKLRGFTSPASPARPEPASAAPEPGRDVDAIMAELMGASGRSRRPDPEEKT